MIRLSIGLAILLTLTGCSGPSKEELLRQQLLEAQRAEAAAAAARREAEAREQRIQERLQQALSVLQNGQELKDTDIHRIFQSAQQTGDRATRFVRLELQPAKYNYADKKQSFSVVGMRQVRNEEAFSGLQSHFSTPSQLELTLWAETEINRVGQSVTRAGGQRLTVATDNVKQSDSLKNFSQHWYWEAGLFDDLSWNISPEEAWELTSGRNVQVQVGLRFCPLADCRINYVHQGNPTRAIKADIISLLILDGRTNQVLAEFIRTGI